MTRTLYGGVVLWAVLATTLHAIHGGASPLLPGVLAPQDGVDGPTGAPDNYLYVSSKDPNRPLLDSALAFIQSSMRLCNITEEVVNGRPAVCDLSPAIAVHNVTYPCMASLDGGLIDTQASAELNQNVVPVYIPLIGPLAAMVAANPSWTELEGPTGVESLYETYGLPIPFGLKGWNTDEHFGLLFKGYYSFFIRQVRSMTDLSSLNGLVSPAQMVQYQTDMNAGRLWIDHHQQEREWWGFSSLVSQSPSEARLTLFRSGNATEPLTPLLNRDGLRHHPDIACRSRHSLGWPCMDRRENMGSLIRSECHAHQTFRPISCSTWRVLQRVYDVSRSLRCGITGTCPSRALLQIRKWVRDCRLSSAV